MVETKRKVCIIVAKVLTGVDQQSKLVDITMYIIKLSVHFFIVSIRRVRICFVRDMSVVNLLNERRPYTAFENMFFQRLLFNDPDIDEELFDPTTTSKNVLPLSP